MSGSLIETMLTCCTLVFGSGAAFVLIDSVVEIDSDHDKWIITQIVISALVLISCITYAIWQITTH